MANRLHMAILKRGVKVWNQWRKWNPRVTPDLRGADLYGADLQQANLQKVILHKADLTAAKLTAAHLTAADLRWALLAGADLQQANLTRADLRGTNFHKADLEQANFCEAVLYGANLREVVLQGTILTEAQFATTSIVAVDLRGVVGLETVLHAGPSSIGIDTLYLSDGDIPEIFLRGCGVPDSMIEYTRSLVTADRPFDYYSCFISYSRHDEALAERLYADLQANGVRSWYAPHDLKIGESVLGGIEQGIRLHDKLLVLLSESSVSSPWVQTEVNLALHREHTEGRRVLFPVRLDDAVLTSGAAWAALIRADHHIGDFRLWKDHDAYQHAFARLLRDLRAS